VKAFFEKTKADARAKQEKPYLMYPRVKLRQVVHAMQDEKRAASKKPAPPLSQNLLIMMAHMYLSSS
jgi:hypothetical protein